MSESRLKLTVIVGSIRDGRFGPVVSNWFVGQAREHSGFDVEVLDLADHNLPAVLPAFGAPPPPETVAAVGAVTPALASADAFVVVTPEYNHSYPASLKTVIDWHNKEWHAKPIAFVSYGGLAGGTRAVEHLRPVFAEVHAVTIRDTVSFHMAWGEFDGEGNPTNPDGCNQAAKLLLDRLRWFASALRVAREKEPYET
jgi:NAD(P)H-dependent FMN reductase